MPPACEKMNQTRAKAELSCVCYSRGLLVAIAVMIIARSGDESRPFQPRQPKKLPHDWSVGSPDAHVLAAAGRYKQGLAPVNAFTTRDATVLDLCKHSILVVSLDSLAELHELHTSEYKAGFRWAPLGPPELPDVSHLEVDLPAGWAARATAEGG